MEGNKLSTWQILRFKFPENEFVLIQQVECGARLLDYMLINLWHSRGLAITGIEQKSNRSDWLKELKNPEKQENHFKYCDYFYLLTDKEGVAKIEEIPETWGWYHVNEKQILKTMKAAPKLNSLPVGRPLLCAMLRRAASKINFVHVDDLDAKINEEAEKIRQARNYALERKAKDYDELKACLDEFEKESGLTLCNYSFWKEDAKDIGKAVKLITSGGLENYLESLKRVQSHIASMHEGINQKVSMLEEVTKPIEKDDGYSVAR